MNKGWAHFKGRIEATLLAEVDLASPGISYWRDRLFTTIIVYLLPVSLVAWVPGVIMSFIGGIPALAVYDTLAVLAFGTIAFNRSMSLRLRKTLLIVFLYLLAVILLYYLGSFGPGLLYLLALSIFITLIFPVSVAWYSVGVNTIISIGFAIIIEFKLLESPLTQVYSLGSWIAVSSNLLFLSSVIVASIQLLFSGLQATLLKENRLQQELKRESQVLEKTLEVMEAKNQELEQFAYIASHDLQEPLVTVTSIVGLLEKQYGAQLAGEGTTYLSFLTQSSARMQGLISGLLEYSRIGKDKQPELVDCNRIIEEVKADLSKLLETSQTKLSIDPLPTLPGYPVELRQLFQNLLTNAIKFQKPNTLPEVTMSAREETGHWLLSVRDNGIGIGEKFQKKIFVIFQRLHPQSKYEGTGIGLAQCKKIVELHGGKIWVDSAPGAGSTFYFTLPKK